MPHDSANRPPHDVARSDRDDVLRTTSLNADALRAASSTDSLLRSSRREAAVVLAIWLAAITYTVGYSYLFGYNRPVESIEYIVGVPDWVMWGVVLPWAVSTVAAVWFAGFFMTDEPLGDEASQPDDFDVPDDTWGEP